MLPQSAAITISGPADQERHEAFEEVDRRHSEEDQQRHDHPQVLAAPSRLPPGGACLDRLGVDRAHRHRRPQLGVFHRHRVLDLSAPFRRPAGAAAGVGARYPVEVGALEGEEDDEEDGKHAEDQREGLLWVRVGGISGEADDDDDRGDGDDPEDCEQPGALEAAEHGGGSLVT